MFRPYEILLRSNMIINNYRYFSRRIVQQNIVRIIKPLADNRRQTINDRDFNPPEYSRKHVDDGFVNQDRFVGKNADNDSKPSSKNNAVLNNVPPFERNSRINNQFSEQIIKTIMKKDKTNTETALLEGKRIINDAIENNLKITYIFFSCKEDLDDIIDLKRLVEQEKATKLIKVTYKEMKIYSQLKTPPGIMAIVQKPDQNDWKKIIEKNTNILPLILICDNVRDPGNMGTIIRTSAAAGIEKIILTEGCVDHWNQKVIKAGSGGHFKIPIESKINWNEIASKLPETFDLFVADVKNPSNSTESSYHSYHQIDYFPNNNRSKVLIIGNEAFGLSTKCYEFVDKFHGHYLKIPLSNNSESLNSAIASAIVIYEIRRQYELINQEKQKQKNLNE